MSRKSKLLFALFFTMAFGISLLLVGPSGELDARAHYTHDEALAWLSSLSSAERNAYALNEYLDFGYLISYSILGIILLGPWALIPGILDVIENVFILLHLHGIQEIPEHLGILSSLKWATGIVMVVSGIVRLKAGRGAHGSPSDQS